MKIILPLIALGLLSTLFLLSRSVDPTQAIPFSKVDLEQRAQELGASNPYFSGNTRGGEKIWLQARMARPVSDEMERIVAEDVTAQIELVDGQHIDIRSDHADVYQRKDTTNLRGNVVIDTSNGFHIVTDEMNTRTDVLYADTLGPVSGDGPPGTLDAGRMVLSTDAESGHAYLRFTDGVKLIYHPKDIEE